jgi:transglutaminase-like putative cysteine protease
MRLFLVLFFLAFGSFLFAQELALGKVTAEELQKTKSDIEPDAPAEFLFRNGRYTVQRDLNNEYVLKVEVYTKIKVYSKEGYKWADYEFPVYTGGKEVKASFSNAFTYNLVDGIIEKTKLEKAGEFTEKINENVKLLKISMPNLRVGSIIEFTYSYTTDYYRTFPEWFFQFEIPSRNCELTVKVPEYLNYNINMKQPYLLINKSESEFYNKYFDYKEIINKYNIKNVLSYKVEAFVANIENFVSSVQYELASVKYPKSEYVSYLTSSWDDVVKNIGLNYYFTSSIKSCKNLEADLSKYIQENESKYNKTEAIFNFVKMQMFWNGKSSKYPEFGVETAYQEKVGNVADINLMLISIFNSQGIKANPVILSTRKNGIMNLPSIAAYNYVVAGVETENGVVLYDATSKNATQNIVPLRALNWFGRMFYSDGTSKEIDFIPKRKSNSSLNSVIEIKNDGSISGKYREQMTDYIAFIYREKYGLLAQELNKERIQKKLNDAEVIDVKLQNLKDLDQPIIEEVTFNKSNAVDFMGDKIYFNPTFMFGLKSNPFLSETRDFPVDFDFPIESKHLIVIEIPAGFKIESLPISTVLTFEDDLLGYAYQVKKVNNTIQILTTFSINYSMISQTHYKLVKDFFSKIVEKNSEQVVLKKI